MKNKLKNDITKIVKTTLFEHNTPRIRKQIKEEISLLTNEKVICDETNNPAEIVDKNSFVVTVADGKKTVNFIVSGTGVKLEYVK